MYWLLTGTTLKGHVLTASLRDASDLSIVRVDLPLASADRPEISQGAVLRAILRWATTYRVREGLRLLDRNPLDGVRLPSRGTNPRRPVATHERFVEARRAIEVLRSEAQSDSELRKWLKLEFALVLAEATGRRLGSFRQLRWNDIDFKTDTILW